MEHISALPILHERAWVNGGRGFRVADEHVESEDATQAASIRSGDCNIRPAIVQSSEIQDIILRVDVEHTPVGYADTVLELFPVRVVDIIFHIDCHPGSDGVKGQVIHFLPDFRSVILENLISYHKFRLSPVTVSGSQ